MAGIGFLSGVIEEYVLLGYEAASVAISFPTFRDLQRSEYRRRKFTSSSVLTLAYFN